MCGTAFSLQPLCEAFRAVKPERQSFCDRHQLEAGLGASQMLPHGDCYFVEKMKGEFPSNVQEETEDFTRESPEPDEREPQVSSVSTEEI